MTCSYHWGPPCPSCLASPRGWPWTWMEQHWGSRLHQTRWHKRSFHQSTGCCDWCSGWDSGRCCPPLELRLFPWLFLMGHLRTSTQTELLLIVTSLFPQCFYIQCSSLFVWRSVWTGTFFILCLTHKLVEQVLSEMIKLSFINYCWQQHLWATHPTHKCTNKRQESKILSVKKWKEMKPY